MVKDRHIINELNERGKKREPFVFLIDFEGLKPRFFDPSDNSDILWKTPRNSNYADKRIKSVPFRWNITPTTFNDYEEGYAVIQDHIHNGDTYLLNYTKPTQVDTDLSLEDIFKYSDAPYKILLKDKFVCFSPEIFVTIQNDKISSFPMKGTIDANIEGAKEKILNDSKELAEHNTIVDLIRNDLSLVAKNVTVESFRYLDRIKTSHRDLWQVSSKISGDLYPNYHEKLGDILFSMLPAGSISGAPKKKTLEIIEKTEKYTRGYYTGIFCYFDGTNLDSCVMIRYVENQNGQLTYKSGGGITFKSKAADEYDEMIKKVYVPIR